VFVTVAYANRIGLPERHSEPGHEAERPYVPAHASMIQGEGDDETRTEEGGGWREEGGGR